MSIDLKILRLGEQLVDGVFGLPGVLFEDHACELSSQSLDPAFKLGEFQACLALQLIEHGANLEDFVTQTHLLKVAVDD